MTRQTFLFHFLILILISNLSFFPFTFADEEILGCGGFVTTSLNFPKNQKVDYSSIKMKLLTLDGVVQDSTECAPNGYYFLPIYGKDKRDFIIKVEGPSGWNFEPSENQVHITDKNECIALQQKGTDINFHLSGFSISGKVVGKNCGKGETPKDGITITLLDSSPNKLVLFQTTTNNHGTFSFSNVKSGTYHLKASHSAWTIEKDEKQVSVELGALEVDTPFIVTGYDLSGLVLSNTEEPVLGVDFLLFSDTIKSINCEPVSTKLKLSDSKKPLCAAQSNKQGEFKFKNIPCGDYQLKPLYQGSEAKTTFDLQPASLSLTVLEGSFRVPQPFRVMGFSVTGRVVSTNGIGISGCVIKVNDVEKTKTDHEGKYKLDQMTSSSYTITASKEHYVFNSLSNYKISPSEGTVLPNITVQFYDLCGSIQITQPPPGITVAKERSVLLKQGKDIHRTSTDLSGKFCFQVASGTYELTPEIDAKEKTAGLVFTNLVLTITIIDNPVLDANFIQSKVILSGRVKCIESPCDPSVSVSLYSENSPTRITSGLGLSGVGKEENQSDYFIFRDVPSGSYKVAINKDSWCWSEDVTDLSVKTEDVVLEFTQTGYSVTVKLSHDANVSFVSEKNNQTQEFQFKKGSHQLCLKTPGVYSIIPKSCYKFEKDVYIYNTSNPQFIELIATHFQVNGLIEISSDKLSSSDISVTIKNENTLISQVLPISVNSPSLLSYSFWAQLGDKFLIKPTSSQLLFYPISRNIEITNFSECLPFIESFQARPGLFLAGKIKPPVEEVLIKVFLQDSEEAFRQVKTDKKGSFSIGPLYDDKNYRLTAEKKGYTFIQEKTSSDFKAMKLGQITVLTKDKDSNFIGGVLLSLSGEGFRSNNVTPSSGIFHFPNLSPGQYFLRPYLKEYTFQPLSHSIVVKEGEEVTIQVNATRYAYSVFGSLISLNGDPEKLLTVEAIEQSSGDHYEGESDIEGIYRIRGLLPQRTYQIRVKQEAKIERASPSFESITIPTQDTYNVSFIVFRKNHKFDLSGVVDTKPEFLQSLKVSLYKKEDSQLIGSCQLSPSNFFDFNGLAKGEYLVKVESSLSSLIYAFSNLEQTINVEENKIIQFSFDATPHMEAQEISNAPLLSTILLVFLFIAAYNYEKVIRYAEEIRDGTFFKKQNRQQQEEDWIPKSLKQPKKKN